MTPTPSILRQLLVGTIFTVALLATPAHGQLTDAQQLYKTGKYAECIELCKAGIQERPWLEGFWLLQVRAEMTIGQYPQAMQTFELGMARQSQSVQLRLLGFDVLRANDRLQDAGELLDSIRELAKSDPQLFAGAANRVALGRTLLLSGVDARHVLELLFDPAKKDDPTASDPHLASGQLALDKNDPALAAESFREAAKRAADDPDVYVGLARAYENDGPQAMAALVKALSLNPRHVDSLLLQADNLIDREAYDEAAGILTQVLDINPKHPLAWAYRATLAHLRGDRAGEKSARAKALGTWRTNPQVDHLIGKKLSQKYRFAEGRAAQLQALNFSPVYPPAKFQLCQDLMRLGEEDEAWKLADEIFKSDPYNVQAFNLVTLHEELGKFAVIANEHFLLRMDSREARLYGDRALDLLMRARQKLATKYGVELPGQTIVEIFPQQKDFAIRTFGMPGGAGYLGVCFGRVITANSPASRGGRPSNWQAVLWHEFCHTVTLTKTRNKMPRWLSEGISVYEERQESRAWGQHMNPQYREMILAGRATPMSGLSGAFLKPPDFMALQFAYYESSMAVQYVVERFGIEAVKQVLSDLGDDVPINDALAKRTEPIEKLDTAFAKWLRAQAEALAPDVDWERPELPLDAGSEALTAWNRDHPRSFFGHLAQGQALLAEQKWPEAKIALEEAAALYPDYAEVGGPYVLLAAVYRGLGDARSERAMLEKHASLSADAVEPRVRLMEVDVAQRDWSAAKQVAEQVLAINPLIPAPHRYLAQAAEALGERAVAIGAYRTLLSMDPLDRAEQHYRLARLLVDDRQLPAARRELVRALEEAPRFRDAHRLLLDIAARTSPPATLPMPTLAPPSPSPAVTPGDISP